MASRLAAHIERGVELKRRYFELVSSWQYDSKTDRFPDFIAGERHALGDLEIDVERWFMSLTLALLRAPWSSSWGSSAPTRSECLKSIENKFSSAFRALRTIP